MRATLNHNSEGSSDFVKGGHLQLKWWVKIRKLRILQLNEGFLNDLEDLLIDSLNVILHSRGVTGY